ncbi:MAG: SUMF1/EgtB/PvdO family nonheme iron enzyme [Candidatus Riflebacteria bacterium]|nr:SUMF1/EgtB/PvdO family nonheme iron enzyme [Candidatus Riflebacteria bacterium]
MNDPISTTATYQVPLNGEGTYTAELTLVDDAGALVTATASTTLQANRAPTGLTIAADPAVVLRAGVTVASKLTVTAVDPDSDGELRYQWEFVTIPPGAQSSELTGTGARVASFAPSRPGVVSGASDYVIKVTVTDAQGLTASTTISQRPKYLKALTPSGNCDVYLSLVDGSEMVQPYPGAGFAIDRTEVSNRQYGAYRGVVSGIAAPLSTASGFQSELQPVLVSTYEEARKYAEWAGKQIPTEAEWLSAAWGTAVSNVDAVPPSAYPWGNESPGPDPLRAHYSTEALPRTVTTEVSSTGLYLLGRTATGIWHLAGNAAEWTETAVSGRRCVRGGSYLDGPLYLQNSIYGRLPVTEPVGASRPSIGFRCKIVNPSSVAR